MSDPKAKAEELKIKGNQSLNVSAFWSAIEQYTEALKLDPDNAAIYTNRSLAYARSGKMDLALEDAEKAVELKPTWVKAYMRKGQALQGLKFYEEAMLAYQEGLKYEPNHTTMLQGVKECQDQLTGPSGSQPLGHPFSSPDLWDKISHNPTTREYLTDPKYKEMITQIQNDPKKFSEYAMDPRIMNTIGVLIGADLSMFDGSGGSNLPDPAEQERMKEQAAKKHEAMKEVQKNLEQKMDKVRDEVEGMILKALEEKDLGNAAYKKKEFDLAIQHYDRAIELDPTNITFRTNKSAVYYEKGELDECIKICEEAVEIGRENRADYQLIAKAFARIGNAYNKKEDFDNALKYYNKSLSEHRDRELAKKVQEIKKRVAEKERLAYINPELAAEEKNQGNEFFKKADYPSAIKHYSEAIKRNPDDAKVYSNRAACYTKLAEFGMALKDAEECIRLDPAFIKGYLRKGNILLALKDNSKSAAAFQQAIEIDGTCQEAIDGYRKAIRSDTSDPNEVRKRAMQNPEVQAILGDPAMQLILQQMQKDPKALHEHLKDPNIAKKIEKLMECGLIAIH